VKTAWEAEGKPGKKVDGGGDPEQKPVVIKHASPAQVEAGTDVSIDGTVDDPDVRVETVDLYYRSGAEGKFTELSLAYSMGAFRGQIPSAAVTPPLVEYYVLAKDKAGLPTSRSASPCRRRARRCTRAPGSGSRSASRWSVAPSSRGSSPRRSAAASRRSASP
jgi:hypothetical protein